MVPIVFFPAFLHSKLNDFGSGLLRFKYTEALPNATFQYVKDKKIMPTTFIHRSSFPPHINFPKLIPPILILIDHIIFQISSFYSLVRIQNTSRSFCCEWLAYAPCLAIWTQVTPVDTIHVTPFTIGSDGCFGFWQSSLYGCRSKCDDMSQEPQ